MPADLASNASAKGSAAIRPASHPGGPAEGGPPGPPQVPGAPVPTATNAKCRRAARLVGKTPYNAARPGKIPGQGPAGLTSPCSSANNVAPARVDTPSFPYTR